MRPVVYIFLNKSLNMSSGKASAQTAHAAFMSACLSGKKLRDSWVNSFERTMIVLEGKDVEYINSVQVYLLERGITTHRIIDEGANEIEPHSVTALFTEVLDKNDESINEMFKRFKKYKDDIKITLELER